MALSKKSAAEKSAKDEPKKGLSALDRARGALKKTLQVDHSVPLSDGLLKTSLAHITSGSVTLDYLIGGRPNQYGVPPCPGWPRGRISNLYGNSGAGKTTVALTTAARVCEAGGTVCYIDWENEVDPRYAAALGVPIHDPSKFDLEQPETLEDGMKIMVQMASEGVDLIVVDSVGAAVPADLYHRDQKEEGNQMRPGLVAQKWSQFLPKYKSILTKSGTTVIGVSQLRKTLSTMSGGGPDSAPQGGEAWKFYSAVRMMLRVLQKEKTKKFNGISGKIEEMVTGAIVIAKLDKCKVSDSVHQEQKFYLNSGTGIDNARSVLDLAVSYGIIAKSGAWFEWSGCPKGSARAQGADAMKKIILEDPAYLPLLFNQVVPKLSAGSPGAGLVSPLDSSETLDDDIFNIVPGHENLAPSEPEGDGDEG
jgi:recombination protein RecA